MLTKCFQKSIWIDGLSYVSSEVSVAVPTSFSQLLYLLIPRLTLFVALVNENKKTRNYFRFSPRTLQLPYIASNILYHTTTHLLKEKRHKEEEEKKLREERLKEALVERQRGNSKICVTLPPTQQYTYVVSTIGESFFPCTAFCLGLQPQNYFQASAKN